MGYKINQKSIFIAITLVFSMLSCNTKDPLRSFDKASWQSDTNGCNGQRKLLLEEFVRLKNDLKGVTTTYMTDNLGNPDETEVVERSQMYFRYFIFNPSACVEGKDLPEEFVQLRTNATGLVDEVIVF